MTRKAHQQDEPVPTIEHGNAVFGTGLHTSIIYGAPLIGLTAVDIAGIIGKRLLPNASARKQFFFGSAAHLFLGAVLFPLSYNIVANKLLPRKQPHGSVGWATILWLVGERIVIPLLGRGDLFKRHPDASMTYFLAHIFYGLGCATSKQTRR